MCPQTAIYLLSVEELEDAEKAELLKKRALGVMDSHRRAKAERLSKGKAGNLAIGAGLLLQFIAQDTAGLLTEHGGQDAEGLSPESAEPGGGAGGCKRIYCPGISRVLDLLREPLEITYRYGENGKPEFAKIGSVPHFNLSHSGKYVLCAVSDAEVGADIQQMRPLKDFQLARRFFSPGELQRIMDFEEHRQREKEFYRLWVRKEAYGKLTGEGIISAAGLELDKAGRELVWEDCPPPEGYQLAVCRHRIED